LTWKFSFINSLSPSIFISGTDGSSYRKTVEIFNVQTKDYLNIDYLLISLIFAAVTSAALLPERSIEPYVGPILAIP